MSTLLYDRWAGRQHVGEARPRTRVFVRTGRFARGYTHWTTDHANPARVNAKIYGEKPSTPWTATWTPDSAWVELPNITEVQLTQDFDSNGLNVATITLDNVVMTEQHGAFNEVYHLIDRGYLSPWRGANNRRATVATSPRNEWYGKLAKNAQLRVHQGYGDDALEVTFTGLIDDCDVTSRPDTISITARDFGQALVDQHVFGWAVSPPLPEPVIFRSLGVGADGSTGTGVGFDASASSSDPAFPPRGVVDNDVTTLWRSHDHTTPANTEWVQVRLPRGRYESLAIHAYKPGMEAFIGIYARSDGLGGESCSVDDADLADGWVGPSDLDDPAGAGTVPGDNGGWAYFKHLDSISDAGHSVDFGHSFGLGDGSVLRVGFRALHKVTDQIYRAGVIRLVAVKRTDADPVRLRPVGTDPDASSTRTASSDENFHAANVIDAKRDTRWLSVDHSTEDNTEWVQIRVPAGRYDSIRLDPTYPGMDCYIGVYARQGKRAKPAQLNGNDIPDGWVDVGFGDVPGAHGGWPYVHLVPALDRPDSPAKLTLGHRFDLGADSVIRVGFRKLYRINQGVYRTGVARLAALTRTGVEQDEATIKTKVVQVGDLSDVVKVVLRWAGFKEWDIEPVGAPLKGDTTFNRSNTLMDIINKAQEATGYVFYMGPPSSDDGSIGVPVFRSNASIVDPPAGMPEIHDTDMISDIQAKATDEPLGYIIRVRGKTSDKYGVTLGGDLVKRVMAVYRPPWTHANKLAGLIKHVTHTEPKLEHTVQCMVMCQLIALQEALVASAAEVNVPGLPDFSLNQQVALVDTGTGLNTRLYIARRSSTFTAGASASWKTTLGGALIDTDDIRGVISDLRRTLAGMGLNPDQINLGDPFGSNA